MGWVRECIGGCVSGRITVVLKGLLKGVHEGVLAFINSKLQLGIASCYW